MYQIHNSKPWGFHVRIYNGRSRLRNYTNWYRILKMFCIICRNHLRCLYRDFVLGHAFIFMKHIDLEN